MHQPFLPAILLGTTIPSDEAVTVVHRVEVTSTIVDAQFISATPKAIELYGYDDLESFRNSWLSKTQTLTDFKHTLALSLCRHFGEEIPRQYVHTLVRPDGDQVTVVKKTQELDFQGELYWVTRLREMSPDDMWPRLDEFDIPDTFERYRSFMGCLSMAEVEGLLVYFGIISPGEMNTATVEETIANCLELTQPTRSKTSQPASLLLRQPITKLPNQVGYLLECQSCGVIWIAEALPDRCWGPKNCQNWHHVVTGN